ncbi:MAG: M23 family metallopeptidase [bacterium]
MFKFLRYIALIFLCKVFAIVIAQDTWGRAPDYLWPTDASKHLTSAFCEYRGRRFHAGIDIKTWGRIGYRVFAIRPGYIWRISVSPFGYGKAIYLKLDTGEIVVYAHLSKFSDKFQNLVEAEQQRLGKYRINKYFKPGTLPVAQGEIIAFTGQTGIGAPHLHFEIRDSGNHPINPLSKVYQLPDKVTPFITGISFTPLDAHSEVNGDFKPVIVTPQYIRPGQYLLNETISIWGNVGLAISCYDKSSNSINRYGIYSLKLFIDENLRFQYKYDKFSFQNNRMVELERDYRLARRGLGRYYKLYKDKHNILSNYIPNKPWAGVLKSVPLVAVPNLKTRAQIEKFHQERNYEINGPFNSLNKGDFQTSFLFPGIHDFKIEVSDYFGNISTVRGKLQVGAAFDINPIITEDENGKINLENIITYDLKKIVEVDAFVLNDKRWQLIPFEWKENLEEKGGEGALLESFERASIISLTELNVNSVILKFIAQDQWGGDSYPYIYVPPEQFQSFEPPQVTINYDFYDEYLRLELNSNIFFQEIPQVIVDPGQPDSSLIIIHQKELNQFIGRIELNALNGSDHSLKVTAKNLKEENFTFWDQFVSTKITPSNAESLISEDRNCWVNFWSSSIYKPIFGRIAIDTLSVGNDKNFVGNVYNVEPKDVPLNAGAIVYLRYPQEEQQPEKLGVYYKNRKGKWDFIDNKIDKTRKIISAKVFSLEEFALIRDDQPPEITRIRPRHKAHITTQYPRILVHVRDKLSGIGSENDIVILLDGKNLIAEYDPERHRLFYQFKEPLPKGRHEITVWAQDNSKNDILKKTEFWIE